MTGPRKARLDACTRLAIIAGALSRDVHDPCARARAAALAETIEKSWHERHHTASEDLVRRARTMLKNQIRYPEDLLDVTAEDARAFAEALYAAGKDARRRERRAAALRNANHERTV